MLRSSTKEKPGRARLLSRGWLAVFLLLAAPLSVTSLAGQVVPQPADTIPADTIPADTIPADTIPADTVPADTVLVETVPVDTIPVDTVLVGIPAAELGADTIPADLRDSAEPPVVIEPMPEFPLILPVGWAFGRWEWSAAELARLPGMALIEFLELLPGMARFRAGGFGRPVGITALGLGGGSVQVLLDGYELDPLIDDYAPLETLALQDIERVRVERSTAGIRVEVETFRLLQPEPHSVVALGTGAFDTRMLQALFSRAFGGHSVGTGAFDLASTGGIGIREQYRHSNVAFRWATAIGASSGLEAEWRRTGIDREGDLFPQQTARTDLIVRGRSYFTESFVVEAIAGRTSAEEEADAGLIGSRSLVQGSLRAAYAQGRASGDMLLRARGAGSEDVALPGFEAETRWAFQPVGPIRVGVEGRAESVEGEPAASFTAQASASPLAHLTVFAALSGGRRFARFLSATEQLEPQVPELPDELAIEPFRWNALRADAGGWRVGTEVAGVLGSLGIAALQVNASPVAPFGLPFDRLADPVDAPALSGLEGYAHFVVPHTGRTVYLDGWYTRFIDAIARPYLPADLGRASINFHGLFYEGELEPSLRLEGVYRGRSRVPDEGGEALNQLIAGYQTLNFALHLRILDVQLFLLWDNLLNSKSIVDLHQAPESFPRVVYGASWRFRN